MEQYLKQFANHSQYESYIATDFVKPNVSYCVSENEVHYNPYVHDYADDYFTFVALESGTFTFEPKNSNVISYSTDNGETWTEGNSVSVNNGDKVLWKGTMTPSTSSPQGIGTFSSTAEFDVQGNAMSLLYGDNFKGQTDLTGKNYAFYNLFYENVKIVNAESLSLPATTLAYCCYSHIFYGCTSLTTAPKLPATTLADDCYVAMFSGCASLVTAPKLPATILGSYCYNYMFKNCTSLTTAPVLSATTLTNSCYREMFWHCTSLTTAPELPAETLANYCYREMFQGCTNLTTAPVLPATTLVSDCYREMFKGCTNLNYIKAMFTTTPSTSYTKDWVSGVSATGTFVKNSAASWNVTGVNGVPNGWTVETASA